MIAVGTRRTLDTKGTDAVMAAAEQEATQNGYRVVITVVDAFGHVLQLRRTEGAQAASDQVAIDKARTAAIFVRPSREIEEQVSAGRLGALALHGAAALTGGIPLTVDGEVIGAIGTSGETPDQDESVSLAGARTSFSTTDVPALTREGARVAADAAAAVATARAVWPVVAGAVGISGASSADEDQELSKLAAEAASAAARDGGGKAATYFPAESIAAKFATGGLLHDTPSYKIDAGRRTAPGEVEYHEHVADIMHVVSGTATVVIGGQMIASHTVGPGEMRAAAMEGGTRHELGAGDVLVIPPGAPHHFAAVSDPFLYLVAKVQD